MSRKTSGLTLVKRDSQNSFAKLSLRTFYFFRNSFVNMNVTSHRVVYFRQAKEMSLATAWKGGELILRL